MKEKASEHIIFDENSEPVTHGATDEPRPDPNSKGIKSPPWHEKHARAIDETDPSLYPMLYGQKGAKQAISLHPFQTLVSSLQQVFDCNRHIFKTITQVYNLAFYRGAFDLQYQYIIKQNISISAMSQYLLDHEKEFEEEREISRAIDFMKTEIDKFNQGYISEAKYLDREEEIIATFQTKKQQDLVRNVLHDLISNGEIQKSAHRLDMEKRRREAKRKNIKVI